MRLLCLLVTLIATLSLATGAVHAQSAGGGGALAPRAPGAGASPALDTEAPRANDALALAIYRELVEINTVTRGTVHRVRRASLTPLARETLLADIEIPVLASEDVYGGKLVAAMDRQHPRDLFDVMELFKHEGITPGIRRAFVVYLASHNRPVHEVLFPELRDIQMDYERHFQGMTSQPTELTVLLETRDRMIEELHAGLDADERRFLLSLVKAEPEWELLGIPHVSELPAVRWKLQNLVRFRRERAEQFELQYNALAGRLLE